MRLWLYLILTFTLERFNCQMLAYCEFRRLPDLISEWEVLGLSAFWNAGNVIYIELNGSAWLAESIQSSIVPNTFQNKLIK